MTAKLGKKLIVRLDQQEKSPPEKRPFITPNTCFHCFVEFETSVNLDNHHHSLGINTPATELTGSRKTSKVGIEVDNDTEINGKKETQVTTSADEILATAQKTVEEREERRAAIARKRWVEDYQRPHHTAQQSALKAQSNKFQRSQIATKSWHVFRGRPTHFPDPARPLIYKPPNKSPQNENIHFPFLSPPAFLPGNTMGFASDNSRSHPGGEIALRYADHRNYVVNIITDRISKANWYKLELGEMKLMHFLLSKLRLSLETMERELFVTRPLGPSKIDDERKCFGCHRRKVVIDTWEIKNRQCNCSFHPGFIALRAPASFLATPQQLVPQWEKYWSCCRQIEYPFSRGCQTRDFHALQDVAKVSHNWSFLFTPARIPGQPKYVAVVIDCEMGTNWLRDPELIQICVLDFFTGEIIFCYFVAPGEYLVSLNTMHSGVTWEAYNQAIRFGDVLEGWERARHELLRFIDAETILIGHDIRNDLRQLRLIHHRIVDTSIVCMTPWNDHQSLQKLVLEVGGVSIRDHTRGQIDHCVAEDALATRQVLIAILRRKIAERRQKFRADINRKAVLETGEMIRNL